MRILYTTYAKGVPMSVSRKPKRLVQILILLLIGAATIVVLMIGRRDTSVPAEVRPAPVRVEKVQRTEIRKTITLSGMVDAAKSIVVSPKVSGTLVSVSVNVGDRLREGEQIGLVDPEPYRIALEQARIAMDYAKRDLERTEHLYESNSIGSQALDAARAQSEAATAQYDMARLNYDNTHITAPVSGTVVHRSANPGSLVSPGTPIVTIDSSGEPLVVVQVPERYASRFIQERKPEVSISIPSAEVKDSPAMVRSVSLFIKPEARSFEVLCSVQRKQPSILPGMYAAVTFIIEERRAVPTLPIEALVDDSVVWILDRQSMTAQRIDITSEDGTAPFSDGLRFVVPEVLSEAEFIVEGQRFLNDGAVVTELIGTQAERTNR